jgi:uncharacterized protein YecT (DUF1311 family)
LESDVAGRRCPGSRRRRRTGRQRQPARRRGRQRRQALPARDTGAVQPCSGQPNARNTLQQAGCAEQQILRTDGQINALAKSVFSLLPDNAARRRFDKASSAWLAYRRADCLSVSDVFEGGTQAPVLYAQCEAARNAHRLKDLRTFKRDLTPH